MGRYWVISILIGFFMVELVGGCKPEDRWDCIKSTGKVVSEVRSLAPFKKLRVYDKIEVEVYEDTAYWVEVQAGSNLMSKIQTQVEDSALIIKNLNQCNFVRDPSIKVVVKVYMPHLLSVHHYGYGNIYVKDTLYTDSVAVYNEGNGDVHLITKARVVYGATFAAGDVYLEGYSRHLYYHLNGYTFLYAKDLQVIEYIFISSFSTGDVYVYPLDWLQGELRGTGNLYYRGNPEILGFKITKGAKLIPIP